MIKDKQKQLNQLQVLFDGMVIALAYFLAWYFAIKNPIFPEGHGVLAPRIYFLIALALLPGYLILYWFFGLYKPMRTMRMKTVLFKIIQANSVGLLLSASLFFAFRKSGYFEHFSTKVLLFHFLGNIFLSTLERFVLRRFLATLRKKGFNQKHIMLVGFSAVSDRFIDACKRNPDWGYTIYGIVDDFAQKGMSYRGVSVIGKIKELGTFLSENTIDEIAITLPLAAYEKLPGIVAGFGKN